MPKPPRVVRRAAGAIRRAVSDPTAYLFDPGRPPTGQPLAGLVGFYGWGNYGDELFLEVFREHLGASFDLRSIIDPANRTIEAWRLEGKQYLPSGRGQGANPLIRSTTPDVAVSRSGYIIADPTTGATTKHGVFAGGDIVTGGATSFRRWARDVARPAPSTPIFVSVRCRLQRRPCDRPR